ncbi:scarecrow-like protein 32 [Aristolochia californica]|uniref:scarecrow-like protein 32 n=1 Tax=Aristolochia californica TaxID=171875 RepID=UPI0035DC08DA
MHVGEEKHSTFLLLPDMKTEHRSNLTLFSLPNRNLFNTLQGSLSGALKGSLGSLDGASIEKLLLHCARALENNDLTLAQQVMWVLNNVASGTGDPNQRLSSWFLRALVSRASRICPTAMGFHGASTATSLLNRTRFLTVTELAGYVDLIPWHQFGFCASNSVIYKAIQGCQKAHILDFSITHCMQWPTLIHALAKRPEGPPSLRITVPSIRPQIPPLLNVSIEEVGLRLSNFAKSKEVPFEFHVIECPPSTSNNVSAEPSIFPYELLLEQLNPHLLDLRDDEALIVNCQNWLRYLPDEPVAGHHELSLRDGFLETISSLNPQLVVVVDEDSDLDSSSLTSRITTCFNYLWIPFDALETFLSKDSCQRMEYEAEIGYKIENIIGFEGLQRIERLESGVRLVQRMKKAHFLSLPFYEDTLAEVKFLLEEHASGWGMKREEDMLVLTWKGHNSVFATAWSPCRFEE